MLINYNNRRFRCISNSANGDVSTELIFEYKQQGNVLTCDYSGKEVVRGNLIARVEHDGSLQMSYHHIDRGGLLKTGVCNSTPEIMPDGKIRLKEKWKWTSGDLSEGMSVLEEI